MPDCADVRLITLDPAHFHAALVQKEMLPGVDPRASIYATLGPDLLEHLARVERFNSRAERPTAWELDVHCSPDPQARMCAERPGNVVMLAGRNSSKIRKIQAALDAGLNVLADKPWIIQAADLPALETALETAARKGLVAYDMMTERYEITSIIQRELVNNAAVFGAPLSGTEEDPAVFMESIHHIMKTVAGVPGRRPAFFFDIREEGEGLADVGTHLVDLVRWTLFPGQSIQCPGEIEIRDATRWPTPITLAGFRQVTGLAAFPAELAQWVTGDRLDYYCNNQVRYQLRGVHTRLNILWNWESPTGVDLHYAVYRGSHARVEVRQGANENFRPEIYVAPEPAHRAAVEQALRTHVERMQTDWPGLTCEPASGEFQITIPDVYRVGHEAHFAQVLAQFLEYFRAPKAMAACERPNMIAKYYVTTAGSRG
jgi:predicted dehydrogenase